MDWNKLFSSKLHGDAEQSQVSPERSHFEIDFDRVVFSSAFRRLQDKTQVIPLPEKDFVHSRLTHSLEASCVGRSLGRFVGRKVIDKYDLPLITFSDFGSAVAAACLAHDIGNPPFGHSGENAISSYFKFGKGNSIKAELSPEQWNDLIAFEGNANGFRLLTNTKSSSGGGTRLTFTTLATFTKYPRGSTKVVTDEEPDAGSQAKRAIPLDSRASQEKYGYFQAEKDLFETVFDELQIRKLDDGSWCRHPLAFLVEAADDICYRIIDFEDGVRAGLIPFKAAEETLRSALNSSVNIGKYNSIKEDMEKLGYLRAKMIHHLIIQVVDHFWKHEEQILAGDYDKHLTKEIECARTLDEIKKITKEKVYNSANVLQIEAAGFSVLGELLDMFINAVNDAHGNKEKGIKPESSHLLRLLPKQFLFQDGKPDDDLYIRVLQICEFVAGMTDTYAMTLYRRLKGIELPRG